jgi:hypothetical protein
MKTVRAVDSADHNSLECDGTTRKVYTNGELNLNEVRGKFLQLCDIAVQNIKFTRKENTRVICQ